jgi:uncharacterized protein YraI
VAFDLGCWGTESKWHRDGWLATSARMLHGKYQLGVKVVKTKRRVKGYFDPAFRDQPIRTWRDRHPPHPKILRCL